MFWQFIETFKITIGYIHWLLLFMLTRRVFVSPWARRVCSRGALIYLTRGVGTRPLLADIAKRQVRQLLDDAEGAVRRAEAAAARSATVGGPAATDGGVVDAHSIARLSLSVFIEYIFGREWEPAFEPLVAASWEWRKEIAVRSGPDLVDTPPAPLESIWFHQRK